MMNNKVKIYIADDHPIVAAGLKNIFSGEKNIEICGSAGSVEEASVGIDAAKPHLLITDINFNGINTGIDFIREVHRRHPDLKILAISMLEEEIYAERIAKAGAAGYIMKSELTEKIVSAVKEIMRGGIFFNPAVLAKLVGNLQGNSDQNRYNAHDFTNREFQVFELIADGDSAQEISRKLSLSPKTVDTYKSRLRVKLNLKNTSELKKFAIRFFNDKGKQIK